MHVAIERKRVIVIELGVMEAKSIVKLLHQTQVDEDLILAQLRDRLEYHVTEAEKGNPRV